MRTLLFVALFLPSITHAVGDCCRLRDTIIAVDIALLEMQISTAITINRDVISDVIGEMSTAGENIRRRIKTVPDPIRAQHALAIVDSVPQRSIGEMISKANSLMQLSSNKPDEWKFSVEIANTAGVALILIRHAARFRGNATTLSGTATS